jgi:hypothetical protein
MCAMTIQHNFPSGETRRDVCRKSIPLLSLSSYEAEWSGLVRILFVEPGDGFEFVNIFCWLPVGLVEAGPFDEVLETLSTHP